MSNLFSGCDFVTVSPRKSSNVLVKLTQSNKGKKNEISIFINKLAMSKSGFSSGDRVDVQFAENGDVCRLLKSNVDSGRTITKSNESGVVRMIYNKSMPNFLEDEDCGKVRYVHVDGFIEFKDGQLTFRLKKVKAF